MGRSKKTKTPKEVFKVEWLKNDLVIHHLDFPMNKGLKQMHNLMREDNFYLNIIGMFVQANNKSKLDDVINPGDTIRISKEGEQVYELVVDDQLLKDIQDTFIMGVGGKIVSKTMEFTSPVPYEILEDFNHLGVTGKLFILYHGFTKEKALEVLTYWYNELDHTKLDDEWKAKYQNVLDTVTEWAHTYTDENESIDGLKSTMHYARVLSVWLRGGVVSGLCGLGKKTAMIIMDAMWHLLDTDALEFMDQEVVSKLREEFPAQKEEVLKYYTPYRKK